MLKAILAENEYLYLNRLTVTQRPKTDEEILHRLLKLYPTSEGLKSMVAGKLTINSYRQKMNKGQYPGGQIWPPSFRYNNKRQRVNGKSGKGLLSPEKQEAILLPLIELQRQYRLDSDQEFNLEDIKYELGFPL